mgnify:CR=1 FL=1
MAAFFGFKKSLNTHFYQQGVVKLSKELWWYLQKHIRKYKKPIFPLFIDICDRLRTYRTRFGTYRARFGTYRDHLGTYCDHLCRCL